MKNKIFLLFLMFFLQSCSSYEKLGTILPDNDSYYKERLAGGSSVYDITIPYPSSEYGEIQTKEMLYKDIIELNFPRRIYDKNCLFFSWILIPLYYGSCDLDKNKLQENDNIYIYIYKPYYTNEFIDNVYINLRFKDKIYIGKKEDGYGNNLTGYSPYTLQYIQFKFPITIKDIKENGAELIVNYKNYHKEIPIGYKLMWYRG